MMANSNKSKPLKYTDDTLIKDIKEFEHGTRVFLKDRYILFKLIFKKIK